MTIAGATTDNISGISGNRVLSTRGKAASNLGLTGGGKVRFLTYSPTSFELITSVTGTGVSTLTIDGCFSSKYLHYLLVANVRGSSAGNVLALQLRAAGTTATGANYRHQRLTALDGGEFDSYGTGGTEFTYGMGYLSGSTNTSVSKLWLSQPFETVRTTGYLQSSKTITSSSSRELWTYAHDLTTSYDGFICTVRQGDFIMTGTCTGTIYVYGLVA